MLQIWKLSLPSHVSLHHLSNGWSVHDWIHIPLCCYSHWKVSGYLSSEHPNSSEVQILSDWNYCVNFAHRIPKILWAGRIIRFQRQCLYIQVGSKRSKAKATFRKVILLNIFWSNLQICSTPMVLQLHHLLLHVVSTFCHCTGSFGCSHLFQCQDPHLLSKQ